MDLTKIYDKEDFNDAYAKAILLDVIELLEKRGYNSINQIVGYLMSGDLGYITSYEDARGKIASIERSKLLEILVKELKEKKWEY